MVKNVNLFKIFKKQGLILQSNTTKFLNVFLENSPNVKSTKDAEELIQNIIVYIDKENLNSNVLTRACVQKAIEKLIKEEEEEEDELQTELEVISAFDTPKFKYDADRKQFIHSSKDKCILPSADAKTQLFRDRYALILQRLKRHPLFTPPAIATVSSHREYFKLISIDSLKSTEQNDYSSKALFGMLVQLEEEKYFLEDASGAIEIDLTDTNLLHGFYVENVMVVAEGYYKEGVFHVSNLGLPPVEDKMKTKELFKTTNFFGGEFVINQNSVRAMKEKEEKDEGAMMITLSDVWLDKPEVLTQLKELFNGYQHVTPAAFLFIGNFTKEPYGAQSYFELKKHFQVLANLLEKYPTLVEKSRFIFVPGPQDPGPADIIPRPPLPDVLTQPLTDLLGENGIFTSNPCRIRYYTQEIVVFREDLISKMHRYCILPPSADEKEMHIHLTKTLLSQSHLCPMPLHVRPIYWGYDTALQFYPLPDTLIIADKYEQFVDERDDVVTFNPGSFLSSKFSFMVYWFSHRQPERSMVPEK